ncbi:MAG: CHAT domain-containing protein [Gammaproteobacteria bacterium]|nr:CHAT domain-containing protein [Gammaproteobacteria bacterium]
MESRTILILAANPADTERLRLDRELRQIEAGLERAAQRDRFIVRTKHAARAGDARSALLDYNPVLVQFSGHGEGEQGILFENEQGEAAPVSTEALAGLFKLFAGGIQCVFLNACYSEVQARAIARHIDCVIGMRRAIGDQAAIQFAGAFYEALGAGKTVPFAFELGRNALQMANIPEHLAPVLFSKAGEKNALLKEAATLEARCDYRAALDCWHAIKEIDAAHPSIAAAHERLQQKQHQHNRLTDLNKRLIKRMKEIAPACYRKVGVDLKRIQENGIDKEAEVMLDVLEQFINGDLDAETFKEFWESEARFSAKKAECGLNYPALARNLQNGDAALFLGMDVAELRGPPPPATRGFIEELRKLADYRANTPNPSEICEYFQVSQYGRRALLAGVEKLMQSEPAPFYEMLAAMPRPLIIISAAYDTQLEDAFKQHNKRYAQVSHRHRCEERDPVNLDIEYSDKPKGGVTSCLAEKFSGLELMENGYSLIYRLRGCFSKFKKDSLLLSEQDYLAFAKSMEELIPAYIISQLNERGFWFLGHYPMTWENRLLISAILEKRNQVKSTTPALAIHKGANDFAKAYWKYQRVDVYDVDLKEFIEELSSE